MSNEPQGGLSFADRVSARFRETRRRLKLGQATVAERVDLSVSAVSRLERGDRGLRVDQMEGWARAFGQRVELLNWAPLSYADRALSDDDVDALCQLAAALPHLPPEARDAILGIARAYHPDVDLSQLGANDDR